MFKFLLLNQAVFFIYFKINNKKMRIIRLVILNWNHLIKKMDKIILNENILNFNF